MPRIKVNIGETNKEGQAMTSKANIGKARPRTSEQVVAEQKEQAAALKAAKITAMTVTKPASTALAVPDNRPFVAKYIDEIAPANIVGRMIKFGKEGTFVTADDDEVVAENAEFIALCDETLVGYIKFSGEEGVPPERHQGLLYDGFILPKRETLSDWPPNDSWPIGLNGEPEDPHKHQNCVPLQNTKTREMFTFCTTSATGRRAVGNLLKHYNRTLRLGADEYPVVRLRPGGFNHRDPRVGWVAVPTFQIVGRAPKTDAIRPDTPPPDTSAQADLNDEIPYLGR